VHQVLYGQKMEMQKIIGMLAKMQERMDASQAKADANQAEMKSR
jgi:hypothetical protein